MSLYACPVCHTEMIVVPSGPKASPVLFVASKPEDDDIKHGKSLSGAIGTILRQEFAYNYVDIRVIRSTSLHIHMNTTDECLKFSASEVLKETKDKKLVVLIGAEATKYFLHKSINNTNGLLLPCDYFSAPVICMEKPLQVFKRGGTVGELRFAIRNIADFIKKKGLL